ncbi:UDP-glycosyltransferase UGT5-like [Zophobas morio]|uniref:UDP-glycosyltransferase UGT5-like n=1 Tax=Zophobas morio TaxID=2755281 RepID=UPI003082DD22
MTNSFLLISVTVLATLTWQTDGAKILAVFSMPSYSHFQLGFRIAKELADRGHQVTAISPYPQKTPIKNYKDVSLEELVPFVEELKKNLFAANAFSPRDILNFAFTMGNMITEKTFSQKSVQDLLKSDETFDVMIMEHFVNDALVGIAHRFKIPVVLIGCTRASSINNYIFANPAPSSYVPNILGTFTKHMNFWERLENFYYNVLNDIMRETVFLSKQREIFKKYTHTDLELDDVLYNVSMMLTTSHVSINDALPHVPSMVEIGGFHVNPPKKLPQDLQTFLDQSSEGVILFSMGSNLKSKDLKLQARDALLRSFAKIKQKVLWKFEEELPNAPGNVKVMKWVPQQDVLAHPNVKAFISHGGLLSTIETVYFGVPIIGIPVFADQKTNVANAAQNGYAVSVPLAELSEEKLSWALDEIINNPKYRENVKQRSEIMHDRPLKPIDAAIYWIEHVIRHQGAPHFRNAGLDLMWYQRHLLDVFAFLGFVMVVGCVVFFVVLKKITSLCFTKQPTVTKLKKNK